MSLRTRDRRGGKLHAHILVATTHRDQRYLVSMLGEGSGWVQDVRATNGAAYIKRGGTHAVVLTEIPQEERAPILKAWCQVARSGRRHLPVAYDDPEAAFEAIAAEYPVFRIDPAGS